LTNGWARLAGTALLACAGGVEMARAETPTRLMPVAVFGADDRVALPAAYKRQQEAIGVLFNLRSRSVCTAFCVAETTIATAGHCLFGTAGEKKPRLTDFWFARNYDQVRDYARIAGHLSGATAQNVIAGAVNLSVSPPIDATSDWALVRLSRPVCAKAALEINALTSDEIVAHSRAGRVFQIAYHRDFTLWRQAYSKPCTVEKDFERAAWATIAADFSKPDALLLHTCDTGGASSGSPLFVAGADGPVVIGINVGTYVQSNVVVRAGQALQRLKPDTIANTGVAAHTFVDRLAGFRSATILQSAAAIKDLQGLLQARGLYDGPIDGAYGAAMQMAIERFEASDQAPVTGVASDTVLQRLRLLAGRG
jgi:V8-like Glu-specific endopeptidase